MIERKVKRTGKIGIFAVAHGTYWEQFEGLKENMMKYHQILCKKLQGMGVEVEDFGMVDTSRSAYEAVQKINGAGVDVLFCNMITYATSSVFAPIIRDCHLPVVLVALQPMLRVSWPSRA